MRHRLPLSWFTDCPLPIPTPEQEFACEQWLTKLVSVGVCGFADLHCATVIVPRPGHLTSCLQVYRLDLKIPSRPHVHESNLAFAAADSNRASKICCNHYIRSRDPQKKAVDNANHVYAANAQDPQSAAYHNAVDDRLIWQYTADLRAFMNMTATV